jgi:hypothetical protein
MAISNVVCDKLPVSGLEAAACTVKRVKEVSENCSTRIFQTRSLRFCEFIYCRYKSFVGEAIYNTGDTLY